MRHVWNARWRGSTGVMAVHVDAATELDYIEIDPLHPGTSSLTEAIVRWGYRPRASSDGWHTSWGR